MNLPSPPKQINNAISELMNTFEISLVDTEKELQDVINLREEIFSNQFKKYGFDKKELANSNFFLDVYDKQSFTFLIRHKESNSPCGTARVVYSNNTTPIKWLPLQEKSKDSINWNFLHNTKNIEISRFAISSKIPETFDKSRILFDLSLSFLLFSTGRFIMFLYDFDYMLALMETPLCRLLKKHNVNFNSFGKSINYFGEVFPYYIQREALLQDTENKMGAITRYYLKQLCQNPQPFWDFIDKSPYLERSDIRLDEICKAFELYGDEAPLEVLAGFRPKKETHSSSTIIMS